MRGWNLKITLRRHGVASTKTVDESVVEAFRTSSNISTHEKVATQKDVGGHTDLLASLMIHSSPYLTVWSLKVTGFE